MYVIIADVAELHINVYIFDNSYCTRLRNWHAGEPIVKTIFNAPNIDTGAQYLTYVFTTIQLIILIVNNDVLNTPNAFIVDCDTITLKVFCKVSEVIVVFTTSTLPSARYVI